MSEREAEPSVCCIAINQDSMAAGINMRIEMERYYVSDSLLTLTRSDRLGSIEHAPPSGEAAVARPVRILARSILDRVGEKHHSMRLEFQSVSILAGKSIVVLVPNPDLNGGPAIV